VHSVLTQIHDGRAGLLKRLETFADVIKRRWEKRGRAKREALLKEVVPDLEEKQWLILRHAYSRESLLVHARSPVRRRQLLLPWLNAEVLKSNPAVLFAILHYRTAYPPQQWAAFNNSQLTFSWASGFFDVDFSENCVVMYGERYGSLVLWEKDAAHRADIVGFPRAILVLEGQAYLMEVLCRIVESLLDGVDKTLPPLAQNWKELTAKAAFRETGAAELWSPYTHQAFSPPPVFDSGYLVSLAKSRRDATGIFGTCNVTLLIYGGISTYCFRQRYSKTPRIPKKARCWRSASASRLRVIIGGHGLRRNVSKSRRRERRTATAYAAASHYLVITTELSVP
jgi:hypothetical protein